LEDLNEGGKRDFLQGPTDGIIKGIGGERSKGGGVSNIKVGNRLGLGNIGTENFGK